MPHSPTSSGPPNYTPTTCFCCGRRAFGIGFGEFGRGKNGQDKDPLFLCELCLPLLHQIKAARGFDVYENAALDATIEAVGPRIEEYGPDLSAWSESQVRQFVMEIILGFGDSIRAQVKSQEIPF